MAEWEVGDFESFDGCVLCLRLCLSLVVFWF